MKRKACKKPPRRVWYIHHAESEGLFKTHTRHNLMLAEREGADIISRESYLNWMKHYGHKEETVFEQTPQGKQAIFNDDIPF